MRYRPVKLPEDGNAHKNIIEWWYFNGHLRDGKGNRYSFMDCLFRADLKRVGFPFLKNIPFKKTTTNWLPYVHFAHSIVSDIGRQKNYKEIQNISLLSRDSFKRPRLFANYIDPLIVQGYANHEIAQTADKIPTFHIKTEQMDLRLIALKPVLLEQGKGFINLAGRKSFYYSYTDLQASGILNIDGKMIPVEGKAWMDHQWANEPYGEYKWTWFSIQLEDGTDIMLAEYHDKKKVSHLADVIYSNHQTEHFTKCVFTPGKDIWKSKKTKAVYPLNWQIEIPENGMKIEVRAVMKDQEIIYGDINYWEGPLEVMASIDGKKIKGVGFMELVGYPSDYNFVYMKAKELQKSIGRKIFRRRKK